MMDFIAPVKPYHAARQFGEVGCDTPLKLLDGTMNWINSNINDLDFVIYTGDSPDHNIPFQT